MGSSVISPEDVLESLMNDGTIDAIRLKIINQLKANVSGLVPNFQFFLMGLNYYMWRKSIVFFDLIRVLYFMGFSNLQFFFLNFNFNYFGWRKYCFCGMTVCVLFWLLILFVGLNCIAVFYMYCWWCSGLLTAVGDGVKECLYIRMIVLSVLFWLLILLFPNISRIFVSLCPMSYCVHAS